MSASSIQSQTASISHSAVFAASRSVAVMDCTSLKWRPLVERMWSIIGTGRLYTPELCTLIGRYQSRLWRWYASSQLFRFYLYLFLGGKEKLDLQIWIHYMEKILISTNVMGSTGPSSCTQSHEIQFSVQLSLLTLESSYSLNLLSLNTARSYVVNMDIYLRKTIGRILEYKHWNFNEF